MFKLWSVRKFEFSHWFESFVTNVPFAFFASFSVSSKTHIVETSLTPIAFQQWSLGIYLLCLVIVLLDISTSFLKLCKKLWGIRKFSSFIFVFSLFLLLPSLLARIVMEFKWRLEVFITADITGYALRLLWLDFFCLFPENFKRVVIIFWVLLSTRRKMIIHFRQIISFRAKSAFNLNMLFKKSDCMGIEDLYFFSWKVLLCEQVF